MPQPDLSLTQFIARQLITSSQNDDIQSIADTTLFQEGDIVDIVDVDALGCATYPAFAAGLTVLAICNDAALVFDSVVDTTSPSGSYYVVNRTIDDGQTALERVYRSFGQMTKYKMPFESSVSAFVLDNPTVGKTRLTVTDASCFKAGDIVQVIGDEGLAYETTVDSIDKTLNYVYVNDNTDISSFTNPKLRNTSLTLDETIMRLKEDIASVGLPTKQFFGNGNCDQTVFYTNNTMIQSCTQFVLDSLVLREGTAGTRASLTNGAGDAQWTATALLLGQNGENIQIEMVDPAAASQPLAVSVSGSFAGGDYLISVSLETDGGSAIISTAQEVVDAVNADAAAKLLVQMVYGGNGTGVQAALTATNLAGSSAPTGDYAMIEQVDQNSITGTGYKILSLNIDPSDGNRLSAPPKDSMELWVCYKQGL